MRSDSEKDILVTSFNLNDEPSGLVFDQEISSESSETLRIENLNDSSDCSLDYFNAKDEQKLQILETMTTRRMPLTKRTS